MIKNSQIYVLLTSNIFLLFCRYLFLEDNNPCLFDRFVKISQLLLSSQLSQSPFLTKTMMHRHYRPHSSFGWRSTRPNEIWDKKRNTAKRLFCLLASDRPPIDKTRRRSRWVERDRTTDSWDLGDEQKQTGPDRGPVFLSGIFRVMSLNKHDSISPTRIFVNCQISIIWIPQSSSLRDNSRSGGRFTMGVCWPPSNPASFCVALIGPAIKHKHRARSSIPRRSFLRTTLLVAASRIKNRMDETVIVPTKTRRLRQSRGASIPLASTAVLRST